MATDERWRLSEDRVTMACPRYDDPADPLCNVELWELQGSRERRLSSRGDDWLLLFAVRGTDLECLVEARLLHITMGIPEWFHQQPKRDTTITKIGHELWRVEVLYGYTGVAGLVQQLPANISSSTLGGSQKLTKAIARIFRTDNAADEKLFLGWDGAGTAEGVEHPVSQSIWRETWRMTREELYRSVGHVVQAPLSVASELLAGDYWQLNELSLAQRYDAMVGYVHGYDWSLEEIHDTHEATGIDGYWRDFAPGSVLFRGAQVSQVNDQLFDVSLEFEIVRNAWVDISPDADSAANVEVTDGPPAIRKNPADANLYQIWKNGWDEYEVRYHNTDEDPGDGEGEAIIPKQRHFVILQKARYCPFNYLGVKMGGMYLMSDAQNRKPIDCVLTPALEYYPGWENDVTVDTCT